MLDGLPQRRSTASLRTPGQIVQRLWSALRDLESSAQLEQAPHGLDSWDERDFQEAFADAFRPRSEVAREAYYPSSMGLPRTHRPRCDLVLTPSGLPLAQEGALPFPSCEPQDATWIELKLAHQFAEGLSANGAYGGQWKEVIGDFRKLASDPLIHHAATALVVFTADESGLERDVATFEEMFLADSFSARRAARSLPIHDRIGHRVSSVIVWMVR